jgi:hypothetical protein
VQWIVICFAGKLINHEKNVDKDNRNEQQIEEEWTEMEERTEISRMILADRVLQHENEYECVVKVFSERAVFTRDHKRKEACARQHAKG